MVVRGDRDGLDHAPLVLDLLQQLVSEVRGLREDMRVRSGKFADPPNHVPLMLTIAATVADRAFSAREVNQHAALVDGALRAALAAAGLVNARRIGKFFRTIEGQTIAGLRLDRIGTDNEGVVWRVSNSHSHAGYGLHDDRGA
jgi:hypothetical protein